MERSLSSVYASSIFKIQALLLVQELKIGMVPYRLSAFGAHGLNVEIDQPHDPEDEKVYDQHKYESDDV